MDGIEISGNAVPGIPTAKEKIQIRVIEVTRKQINILTVLDEELEDTLESGLGPGQDSIVKKFIDLKRFLTRNQNILALWLRAPAAPDAGVFPAILARMVLMNPAVQPIIIARGALADAEAKPDVIHIRTRPSSRIKGVEKSSKSSTWVPVSIAAEEPIIIIGFLVDPRAAGNLCAAAAGAAIPATAAAKPLEYKLSDVKGSFKRMKILPLVEPVEKVPENLLRQIQNAIGYYFGVMPAVAAVDAGAAAAAADAVDTEKNLSNFIVAASTGRGWTWRDPSARGPRELLYILKRLGSVAAAGAGSGATAGASYDMSPLADLYRVGQLRMYLLALTDSESPELEELFERHLLVEVKRRNLKVLVAQADAAACLARMYLTLIEDKFGVSRCNKVLDAIRKTSGVRARGAPGGSLAFLEGIQVDDPEVVLKLLTSTEKNIVKTEYENRLQEWEAATRNKCFHVKLLARLQKATTADMVSTALKELAQVFKVPVGAGTGANANANAKASTGTPALEWHMCKNCGFRVMCFHEYQMNIFRAQRRAASYDEIRTKLAPYAQKIQNAGAELGAYFCRVCSGKIAEAEPDDGGTNYKGLQNADADLHLGLRTRIWAIAMAATKHVRFPIPTDDRKFAASVSDVVYPFVLIKDESLVKRKSARAQLPESDEPDPRTLLYGAIYVYARILDLIMDSAVVQKNGRASAMAIGFEGVPAAARLVVYAEKMLKNIAAEYRRVLTLIEGVSAEQIKTQFTEAYRQIRSLGYGKNHEFAMSPEDELIVQLLTIDPIYRYASTVARLCGDIPPLDGPSPLEDARAEFETTLGKSLPEIVKLARNSMKDPLLQALYQRRTGVEVPIGTTLRFALKDPRINMFATVYDIKDRALPKVHKAIAEFYNIRQVRGGRAAPRKVARAAASDTASDNVSLAVSLGDAAWSSARVGEFFEAYRLFVLYTKITNQDKLNQYDKELARYRKYSARLNILDPKTDVKPAYDVDFKHSAQFRFADVVVSALYDEEGHRHVWTNMVFAVAGAGDGAAKTEQIYNKQTAHKRDTATTKFIDFECSVCKIRMRDTSSLDSGKIRRAIQSNSAFSSFYKFYSTRCPEGNLHAAASDAAGAGATASAAATTCTKCEIHFDWLKDNTIVKPEFQAGMRAFLERYSDAFKAARATFSGATAAAESAAPAAIALAPAAPVAAPAAPVAAPAAPVAAPAAADYRFVIKAAALAGVSPAILLAIGSTENRNYLDIVESLDEPLPITSMTDFRLYGAEAAVRGFIVAYNNLRNAAKFPAEHPSAEQVQQRELMAAAGLDRKDYVLLPKYLPEIPQWWYQGVAAYKQPGADAHNYHEFITHGMCRLIVEIAERPVPADAPAWLGPLHAAFAKKMVATIAREQKLMSKPGVFKWAIFEVEEDIDDTPDQVGDVGEDVMEEILTADTEEAPEDPFSGENMDYDTSESNPNNEPE